MTEQYEPITNLAEFIEAVKSDALQYDVLNSGVMAKSLHNNTPIRVGYWANIQESIAKGIYHRKVEPETVELVEFTRHGETYAAEIPMGEPTGYKIIGQRVKA